MNNKLIIIGLSATLLIVSILALTIGASTIPLHTLLFGTLGEEQDMILWHIRLPRIILALGVGAALAVSGAALQGLFRNPLADPGLIGITSGAALAVALTIVVIGPLGGVIGLYSLSIAAFIGGFIASLVIFAIARSTGGFSVTTMLLAGIAINTLAAAATGFLTFLSDDTELRTLTFWTMGSLGGALWPAVMVMVTILLPTTLLLITKARELNILLLGEEDAHHLGISGKALKRMVILCTALCVGAAVAVSGIIGFIGLIVPHLVRLTLGADHRILIPVSALAGALLLLLADTIARIIVIPAEMPVGIITSLIGGPFFLWLLIKQYSKRFSL